MENVLGTLYHKYRPIEKKFLRRVYCFVGLHS